MLERETFYQLHRNLVAKAIEELHYDEVLEIRKNAQEYELVVNEQIRYSFQGKIGIWGNIQVDTPSLRKKMFDTTLEQFSISEFFFDIKELCCIDDVTLSQYLEEANQTIFSDLKIWNKRMMIDSHWHDYHFLDQNLPGHTKLIMNKGRIGWGKSDLEQYAPEFGQRFLLRWIAVAKEFATAGISAEVELKQLAPLDIRQRFEQVANNSDYYLMAVHPWQWDKYIHNQFLEELACQRIIDLGEGGDEYSAQASIRTLTNMSAKMTGNSSYDVKLSLSILNTSCVRGIPTKYIQTGHRISRFMQELIAGDSYLEKKVDVLSEVAAVKYSQPDFEKIKTCSYRYKELLGCVWRESVQSKLTTEEFALPTAALLLKDQVKKSFVEYLIQKSELTPSQWLAQYAQKVILPLYHLQLEHGLGLVSHGQNIILVVKNFRPERLIIKDFHGDLRMAENSKHLECVDLQVLDRLSAPHLLHDLITGHFITLLRFLSRQLDEAGLISEQAFYGGIAHEIAAYLTTRPPVENELNLLRTQFEKVLVNKVRFHVGYGETESRVKPFLGQMLKNPLASHLGGIHV